MNQTLVRDRPMERDMQGRNAQNLPTESRVNDSLRQTVSRTEPLVRDGLMGRVIAKQNTQILSPESRFNNGLRWTVGKPHVNKRGNLSNLRFHILCTPSVHGNKLSIFTNLCMLRRRVGKVIVR